jgi:hypothetical protein
MQLSDDYMRDAQSDAHSTRGRIDAAFDSGYFALLTLFERVECDAATHPSVELMLEAGRRLGMSMSPGMRLSRARYAGDDERPSLEEALEWAESVRAKMQTVRA